MAVPSYTVEISFGSSGFLDVSSYVQSITLDRGISNQLEDYSAGSISITFVNNARVFDPLNTSSPLWYGAGGYTVVQPGGQVRVKANTITRFIGFIQDWSFTFDEAGLDGKATLSALDRMYRVGNAVFTGGQAWQVEATSDRMKTVFNYNGFGAAEYAGIESGQTMLGYDDFTAGNSVLSYLQQVARSEPGDFFSNASSVMVFKDRSFTDYSWSNSLRQNLIKYPNELTQDTTLPAVTGGTGLGNGWVYGWRSGTAVPLYGGTVNTADIVGGLTRDFWYQEVNEEKINPSGTATSYVFSSWFRGSGLTGSGLTGIFALLDATAAVLTSTSMSISAPSATPWTQMKGTATYSGTGIVAGFYVNVSAPGTAVSFNFIGNGWQVEQGTVIADYFDGGWNTYADTATTRYRNAWAGIPYASESGLLTSTASTVSAPAIHTFADTNSQGTAYGNGTGIPFMDLEVAYGSENLYNTVQVIGVNATAIVEDTTGKTRYGLKTFSQTDNLTTSITRPAEIASALLGEFRLPEYRAEQITISLESLTTAQQNIVLALELRDVVRVCFQPSATGSIVDKYYQILGISGNTDVERDAITFRLASLDNLPFRLDSTLLGVLDTDTLA